MFRVLQPVKKWRNISIVNMPMSTGKETMHETPEASKIEPQKKQKKKRWTAQEKQAAREAAKKAEENGTRPGKKKLRKLNYERAQVSPADFLLLSVESTRFTGSVFMEKPEASNKPSRIQITTSCAADFRSSSSTNSVATETVSIQVQPLLVLDLNGILCHRIRPHREPQDADWSTYRLALGNFANTPVIPRPFLHEFLHFLDQHFCLAIWTSAKSKTARLLMDALVPPEIAGRILFRWGQDKCRAEPVQGNGVPIFEKDLAHVWKEFPLWNAHNTLLMDDSPEKCFAWKHNAIHPPPLNGRTEGATTTDEYGRQRAILSDLENTQQQMEFFRLLVQHWNSPVPMIQEWDVEAGDVVTLGSTKQLDFLRAQAKGYMGWQ